MLIKFRGIKKRKVQNFAIFCYKLIQSNVLKILENFLKIGHIRFYHINFLEINY